MNHIQNRGVEAMRLKYWRCWGGVGWGLVDSWSDAAAIGVSAHRDHYLHLSYYEAEEKKLLWRPQKWSANACWDTVEFEIGFSSEHWIILFLTHILCALTPMAGGIANPLPSLISRMPSWSWDWNKQHCLACHCDESPVKLYYGSSCCLAASVLLTCEIFVHDIFNKVYERWNWDSLLASEHEYELHRRDDYNIPASIRETIPKRQSILKKEDPDLILRQLIFRWGIQ